MARIISPDANKGIGWSNGIASQLSFPSKRKVQSSVRQLSSTVWQSPTGMPALTIVSNSPELTEP